MATSATLDDVKRTYVDRHPGSQQLYERATDSFASGVTHDSRYMEPFPIYASRASGSTKWDVDGNEYVDWVMGHGALLFGYADNEVASAFHEQVDRGVHIGASTELEIEWAELIRELVPCAELVRASSSGSEAISTAIRLSRLHTGNDKIILQAGAYHGKDDQVNYAYNGPPFGHRNVAGIPESVTENVELVPFNDLEAVENLCAEGNVACVILHSNNHYEPEYVEGLRELTRTYGVVFVMDEVVSGFRYAAGGAHEYYDVEPDLAVLGKIVGGGAAVGAVCGSRELMQYHEFRDDDYWNNFRRISVGGTWNAQPLSIIGGIAMLRVIRERGDEIYSHLSEVGSRLIERFNDHAEDIGVPAIATGVPPEDPTRVSVHLLTERPTGDDRRLFETGPASFEDYERKQSLHADDAKKPFNMSMLNEGVFPHSGGLSYVPATAHTETDVETTSEAMETSLRVLKNEGLLG
ncbi:MAG: aspartate aminotransferase family protein [Salinirussus sp.]